MRRALLALVLLTAGLAGCIGTGDAGDATGGEPGDTTPDQGEGLSASLTYEGTDCREPSVVLETDAENVRPFVPEEFNLTGEAAGQATLFVNVAYCNYATGNESSVQGFQSDVGVQIEAPDDSDGLHLYQLWVLTNLTEFANRAEAWGITGGYLSEVSGSGGPEQGQGPLEAGTVEASLPWEEGAYETAVTLAGSSEPTMPIEQAVWWHRTDAGLARIAYTFHDVRALQGQGEASAEAESPLAQAMGGTTSQGAAFHYTFDMKVVAEIVEEAS